MTGSPKHVITIYNEKGEGYEAHFNHTTRYRQEKEFLDRLIKAPKQPGDETPLGANPRPDFYMLSEKDRLLYADFRKSLGRDV